MQRIHDSTRRLSVMDYQDEGGRQLLGMADHGDFVSVRVYLGQNTYASSTLKPDVALAAYEWLGRWLVAQGALVRREAQP